MLYNIRVPTDEELAARFCCWGDCEVRAQWEITYGPTTDDVTDACAQHVGSMLGDSSLLGIVAITKPVVDHLDFVIDGPPSQPAGRFVELEGFYGSLPPARIDSVGGPSIRWVEDPDGCWRLRVAILGGALYG